MILFLYPTALPGCAAKKPPTNTKSCSKRAIRQALPGFLKNHPHLEAFTASLFNFLEQKLVSIEEQLSFKKQEIFNVYSDTEPTAEEMAGKVFWNKEY